MKLLFLERECFEIKDFIPDSALLYTVETSESWSSDDGLGQDPLPEEWEQCIR